MSGEPAGTSLQYALALLGAVLPLMRAGLEVRDLLEAGLERLAEFESDARQPDAQEWQELAGWIDVLSSELFDDGDVTH